jgi:hypothetical protein
MHPRLRPFPSRRALLCQTSSALGSNDGAQAHSNGDALLSVSQLRLPLAREQKKQLPSYRWRGNAGRGLITEDLRPDAIKPQQCR